MPPLSKTEKNLHTIFVWGLMIKAFDGVVETIGGIILFFPDTLTHLVHLLIKNELLEDSNDFLFTHIRDALPALTAHAGVFIGIYLLIHGLIKIGLVYGLLKNKLWAYPSAIAIFTIFIAYQLSHYVFTHSFFLIILSVVDAIVIWLTWHEYQYFKKYNAFAK